MLMNVLLPPPTVTRMHYAAIIQALITVLASRGTLVTEKLAQVHKFRSLMTSESKRFVITVGLFGDRLSKVGAQASKTHTANLVA